MRGAQVLDGFCGTFFKAIRSWTNIHFWWIAGKSSNSTMKWSLSCTLVSFLFCSTYNKSELPYLLIKNDFTGRRLRASRKVSGLLMNINSHFTSFCSDVIGYPVFNLMTQQKTVLTLLLYYTRTDASQTYVLWNCASFSVCKNFRDFHRSIEVSEDISECILQNCCMCV